VNLDPGSKTPNRETQHGDSFAVAMRLIMQRRRRRTEPEPANAETDPNDEAWRDAVKRATTSDNVGGDTPSST
jgi:hypothetical protein